MHRIHMGQMPLTPARFPLESICPNNIASVGTHHVRKHKIKMKSHEPLTMAGGALMVLNLKTSE